MADETVMDPAQDRTVDSQAGQTAADSQVATATAPSAVPIADYKNLQSFATKTSQELKAFKEEAAKRDQENTAKLARAEELEEKFNRLGEAFGATPPAAAKLSPEQIKELDNILQQTPTYRTLAEQSKTQQQAQQTASARQHDMAVNEAAIELTNQFKLTDEQGANLKKFIMEDPAIVGGIQTAVTKEQALRTFRNAYKAWHYDELSKNAVALGTQQVEQKLKGMEATASVDQGAPIAAASGNAEIAYVKGQGLDGVWDRIAANVRQTHGIN